MISKVSILLPHPILFFANSARYTVNYAAVLILILAARILKKIEKYSEISYKMLNNFQITNICKQCTRSATKATLTFTLHENISLTLIYLRAWLYSLGYHRLKSARIKLWGRVALITFACYLSVIMLTSFHRSLLFCYNWHKVDKIQQYITCLPSQ